MQKFGSGISVFCLALLLPSAAFSQVTISSPNSDSRLKSCDEYSTQVLSDPWDMANQTDVNYFIQSDMSAIGSITWTGGMFSFLTTGAQSATYHLLSPHICGAVPVGGRYGENFPIDTSKYTQMTIRMNTDTYDTGGMKFLWHRDCSYTTDRTVSSFIPTRTGWSTYRVDLNALQISTGESSNTQAWSAGNINGFGIIPHQGNGAGVNIDYIRLEDPTSCGSTTVNYNATTDSDGNDLVNLYLDDDLNPFNGYNTALLAGATAAGAGSLSASTSGLAPGNYYVTGVLTSDYAIAKRNNPWDFEGSDDVIISGGISNAAVSGGVFTGTTNSTESAIYLRLADGGISAADFSKFTIKISRSQGGNMQLFWNNGSTVASAFIISSGTDVHTLDLTGRPGWSGTISEFILRPSLSSGTAISLDFVSLRSAGFTGSVSTESQLKPLGTPAGGQILVNDPPVIAITKPDKKGGEAIRPWNMNTNDFVIFQNLRTDTDPANPAESYSTYLPDVRTVSGRRGDFFKGTNISGVDHSVNYSTFPRFNANPLSIDANVYKYLSVMMFNDKDTDVCLGSILRPYWLNPNDQFTTAVAAVTVTDRWTGNPWTEFTFDLPNLELNGTGQQPWTGTIPGLRVDPNEFYKGTCGGDGNPAGENISVTYYYDWIKLRKDFTTDDAFSIVYSLGDGDDDADVDFFYTSTKGTSGGTQINGTSILESNGTRTYVWDTSAVPEGTYYVYAVATDGLNTSRKVSDLPVIINHSLGRTVSNPTLAVESLTDGQTVCDTMQVKGYALMDRFEDVASVEVKMDSTLLGSFQPLDFSIDARTAFPSLDSSNTGFDKSYDVSGFSTGAHTVTVKAFSTDGQSSTLSYNVNKAAAGCPSVVTDPDPAGVPEIIPGNFGATLALTAPTISSAKLSKKGAFSLKVVDGNESSQSGVSCKILLKLGTSAGKISSSTKSLTAKKSPLTLTASKIGAVNVKKLKTVYAQVIKTCKNSSKVSATKSSNVVTFKPPKGMKGKVITTPKALGASIKGTIKVK